MMRIFLLAVFMYIFSGLSAQQKVDREINVTHFVNYYLLEFNETISQMHQDVVAGKIKAFADPALKKPIPVADVIKQGGKYESVRIAPDPKDPYYYIDTLLLNPISTEDIIGCRYHFTDIANKKIETCKSVEFLYRESESDSIGKSLYFIDKLEFVNRLQQKKAMFMFSSYLINEPSINEKSIVQLGSLQFEEMAKSIAQNGLLLNTIQTYKTNELTNKYTNAELIDIQKVNFIKPNSDKSKTFEWQDVSFMNVSMQASLQDTSISFRPKALSIGHDIVITGVDQLKRTLFWIDFPTLQQLLTSDQYQLLFQIVYTATLLQVDQLKTYQSDYYIRKTQTDANKN